MKHQPGQRIYNLYAPLYDVIFDRFFRRARRKAIALLEMQTGERLFIPGIGTGLDLLYLPGSISVTGVELNAAMLEQAQAKTRRLAHLDLIQGDALNLPLGNARYDALLFNLVLSVFPDGAVAFKESWRMLRPGGRAVIFDKFLPDGADLSRVRQLVGKLFRLMGTDPNRRVSDIIGGLPDVVIRHVEPSMLGGRYQIIVLEKTGD
jgi:phosphatidylethanolamine/phosphatidyl-N-methylethanolamine N-methyltransferase